MEQVQHELSVLLQAMLLRELRELREGGSQGLSAKLDELLQAVIRSHKSEIGELDQIKAKIADIVSNPDAAAQVEKLKQLAATLNAMAPATKVP